MPTGMNAGVSITPCGVVSRPCRARLGKHGGADLHRLGQIALVWSCPISHRLLGHSPGLMDMESQQGNELRVPSQSP
jgi:hypothetical protein